MIPVLAYDNAPVAINSNTHRIVELAVAAAFGAYGANMGTITVPQHLNAAISAISHKDVPGAVKGNAAGITELTVTCACAWTANGAEMRTVRVPQNLNAAAVLLADDEVALGVKREEAPAAPKLAFAAASATHAAQVRAIAESKHLHARVA